MSHWVPADSAQALLPAVMRGTCPLFSPRPYLLYFLTWSWYNGGTFFCGSLHPRLQFLLPFPSHSAGARQTVLLCSGSLFPAVSGSPLARKERLTHDGSLTAPVRNQESKEVNSGDTGNQDRKIVHNDTYRNCLKMNNITLSLTQGWLRFLCPLEMEIVLTSAYSSMPRLPRNLISYSPLCTGAPTSSNAVSAANHIDTGIQFTPPPHRKDHLHKKNV